MCGQCAKLRAALVALLDAYDLETYSEYNVGGDNAVQAEARRLLAEPESPTPRLASLGVSL